MLSARANRNVEESAPVPVLILQSREESQDVRSFYASLMMQYGDWLLPLRGHSVPTSVNARGKDGVPTSISRWPAFEMQQAAEFAGWFPGMRPAVPHDPAFFTVSDWQPMLRDISGIMSQWQIVVEQITFLRQNEWKVVIKPPFDVRITRVTEVLASIEPSEGGWFDMGLRITHDGQSFDLVPHVADWLMEGSPDRPLMVQSDAGVFAEVPPELIRPIADTLLELFDSPTDDARLRISPARALSLQALDAEWQEQGIRSEWSGGEKLFALAEQLRNFSGITHAELPSSIVADLRPYQKDGVAWLAFLATHGFNGILADDMGLGKTLQTLAFLEQQRVAGELESPVLVVAPTSVLGNWAREAAKFTPELTVRVWHGNDRKSKPLQETPCNLVITSYALVLRDRDMLAKHGFGYLVLDEAQAIKNPSAKIAQAVKSLPIERRLCLTGTPLENHLHELWSQFDFLMPGLLGSRRHFGRYFRAPIETQGDSERQARLNLMIRPFLLRRKKEDVAADLPPKTEIVREVTMDSAQASLYESIRASMEVRVRKVISQRGLSRSHIDMLDALLKLRQTCCHPQLVKLPSAKKVTTSAKTSMLMSMLQELIDEGKKVLLFSQFTEMLELLEEQIADAGIDYVKLTGRTRKRDEVIDSFQRGDVPLFLISLKAGGTGLNLTAADTVIHYDPWWNPAVENQASDRAHRIGQDKPVFVYKLITVGTVEEKIMEMQKKKQQLSDRTLNGGKSGIEAADALGGMSAEEILSLFTTEDAA